MRYTLTILAALLGVVLIAGAIGFGPTMSRWGAPGVRSMYAIGAICTIAAIIGAAPIGFVAPRWPSYIGQAVLAGTTCRLLLTAAFGYLYQALWQPHLPSYLFWAALFYLLLLGVETFAAVLVVRKVYPTGGARGAAQ